MFKKRNGANVTVPFLKEEDNLQSPPYVNKRKDFGPSLHGEDMQVAT